MADFSLKNAVARGLFSGSQAQVTAGRSMTANRGIKTP
jgi:hypothetical protein